LRVRVFSDRSLSVRSGVSGFGRTVLATIEGAKRVTLLVTQHVVTAAAGDALSGDALRALDVVVGDGVAFIAATGEEGE